MADRSNVWLQGSTALSPAMQDVMRGNEAYYERNLASLGEQFQQEQVQSVARLGAERLAQYGPEGERWAQALATDPYAAYALAESMGGFGEIEGRLAAARAQGAASEALGQMQQAGASPQEIVGFILRTQGPEAAKQAADALGGGSPVLRNGPNGRIFEVTQGPDGAALRLLPGQPEPIVAGAMPGGIDAVTARMLRGDYTAGSADFAVQRDYYNAAVAAAAQAAKDPSSPGAVDFALVQAYGKMLDPNSVVRNEEGKFIVESQSSAVQDALNQFKRMFESAGTLNPTARLNLMRQIEAQYRQAETRHLKYLSEIEGELNESGASGVIRNVATPVGIGVSDAKLNFEPWEAAARAEAAPKTMSELLSMPVGATFTDSEGTWRKTNRKAPNGEPIFEEVE